MTTSEWLDWVTGSALSSRVTVQASYDAAVSVVENGVPGDLVECGVWAGSNAAAMARGIQFMPSFPRRVHLFDSFEGIPEAGPQDDGWTHDAGTSACSIETTKQQMTAWGIPPDLLVYHPGWFKDTIPNCGIKQISLLRLDGDLYESSKVCLEHLYPLVSPGGIVIIDDWILPGVQQALREYGLPNGPIYFHKEP
jgi:hypothetical protein